MGERRALQRPFQEEVARPREQGGVAVGRVARFEHRLVEQVGVELVERRLLSCQGRTSAGKRDGRTAKRGE